MEGAGGGFGPAGNAEEGLVRNSRADVFSGSSSGAYRHGIVTLARGHSRINNVRPNRVLIP